MERERQNIMGKNFGKILLMSAVCWVVMFALAYWFTVILKALR